MHEDRKHNAFAALDILARADSVAFERARGDMFGQAGKFGVTLNGGSGKIKKVIVEAANMSAASQKAEAANPGWLANEISPVRADEGRSDANEGQIYYAVPFTGRRRGSTRVEQNKYRVWASSPADAAKRAEAAIRSTWNLDSIGTPVEDKSNGRSDAGGPTGNVYFEWTVRYYGKHGDKLTTTIKARNQDEAELLAARKAGVSVDNIDASVKGKQVAA